MSWNQWHLIFERDGAIVQVVAFSAEHATPHSYVQHVQIAAKDCGIDLDTVTYRIARATKSPHEAGSV